MIRVSMLVIAVIAVALALAANRPRPTQDDEEVYRAFLALKPQQFADAPLLSSWRGFDYRWRINLTKQCAIVAYDLSGRSTEIELFLGSVKRVEGWWLLDAPREPDVANAHWRLKGEAFTAPEFGWIAQATEPPLMDTNAGFCAMPSAQLASIKTVLAEAWSNDRTPIFVFEHIIGHHFDPNDHILHLGLIDLRAQRLYMWFVAEPMIW